MRDRSWPGSCVRFAKKAQSCIALPRHGHPLQRAAPWGERGRGWIRAIGKCCLDRPEVSRLSWLEALQRSWSELSTDSVGEKQGMAHKGKCSPCMSLIGDVP